jgi:hypothetical protein
VTIEAFIDSEGLFWAPTPSGSFAAGGTVWVPFEDWQAVVGLLEEALRAAGGAPVRVCWADGHSRRELDVALRTTEAWSSTASVVQQLELARRHALWHAQQVEGLQRILAAREARAACAEHGWPGEAGEACPTCAALASEVAG